MYLTLETLLRLPFLRSRLLNQTLRVMRLTALLLVVISVHVSATGRSQTITFSARNVPLDKVFNAVQQQTGYFIFSNKDLLKNAAPVTIDVSNMLLTSFLDLVLSDQPIGYKIRNKTIFIEEKERAGPAENKDDPEMSLIRISGTVRGEHDTPLAGANIRVKNKNIAAITDDNGNFSLQAEGQSVLIISFIGYETKEVKVTDNTRLNISLVVKQTKMAPATVVVSDGYQIIPKERATGSFTLINNEQINRSVSTNLLDRLDGITSGLMFRASYQYQDPLSGIDAHAASNIQIHGRSTINADADPLIVVDNFPYDGDLANINPNDVESITVLKDAAAASAWGSRSGNGVIVVVTKKGKLNSAPRISFNSTITVGAKPDLFAKSIPQLTPAQYIETEQVLFHQGAYDNKIADGFDALSPAVEIFLKARNGHISSTDSASMINALKSHDSRNDLLKYYYRQTIYQQYEANVSGGGANSKYFFSAGYDKNLNKQVNYNNDRVTLNGNHSYFFLNNKLELVNNIIYTGSTSGSGYNIGTLNPYDRLTDDQGRPMALASSINGGTALRLGYVDTAGGGRLLDWHYRPLDELRLGAINKNKNSDYRINVALNYKVIAPLSISLRYGFEKGIMESTTDNPLSSFYTRNLINTYTQIDNSTGTVTYGMPVGDIIQYTASNLTSHNGRLQVDYNNTWGRSALNALAGTEVRDLSTTYNSYPLYGYDPNTASNLNSAIDPYTYYPYYYGSNSSSINTGISQSASSDRYISYFGNASYTFRDRYILSGSARKDESNIFGVKTNQKGVPLWSAGLAWNAGKEAFYHLDWLPMLKVRATYGYTGNVDKSLSAYLTAIGGQLNSYNELFSQITNPQNPLLRWEKIRNINLGIDFAGKDNRISGSVDVWRKEGIDLIGTSPLAPQSGVAVFTGNSANTLAKGMDIQLNSINLKGRLKWSTTLLFNITGDKVTEYNALSGNNLSVVQNNYFSPLKGYPYYGLFSYRYAGLDNTGAPKGYLDGKISQDYSNIVNSTNHADLVYNGSTVPTKFGSLLNTFGYRSFELSFNITFKFGYYFRRTSLDNSTLYGYNGAVYATQADYDQAWKKPGDELHTNVPKLSYPADLYAATLYTNSNVLVEKGDNIRLQDLRLAYNPGKIKGLPFNKFTLFVYARNLGILWRANKRGIDPESPTWLPAIRTVSFGLKADL